MPSFYTPGRYATIRRARIQGYSQFTNQHVVTIEKNIRSKTWNLLLDDQVQYSQGSSFGQSGMEGMGLTSNPTTIDVKYPPANSSTQPEHIDRSNFKHRQYLLDRVG